MRREDWQPRLWKELQAAEQRPFVYGVHDCVRLTARCLDAMLVNAHYLDEAEKLYADKRAALRLLMQHGLDELITRHLGTPVARSLARQGDICSADLPTGPAIGICTGSRFAVAACPDGVLYLPLAIARAAWWVE
jgi:uncharacterized protein DUF6950